MQGPCVCGLLCGRHRVQVWVGLEEARDAAMLLNLRRAAISECRTAQEEAESIDGPGNAGLFKLDHRHGFGEAAMPRKDCLLF